MGGECSSTALLDTEQVPCKSDDVIFPDTSTYYVNLDSGYDITVGSLQMSGSVRYHYNIQKRLTPSKDVYVLLV